MLCSPMCKCWRTHIHTHGLTINLLNNFVYKVILQPAVFGCTVIRPHQFFSLFYGSSYLNFGQIAKKKNTKFCLRYFFCGTLSPTWRFSSLERKNFPSRNEKWPLFFGKYMGLFKIIHFILQEEVCLHKM